MTDLLPILAALVGSAVLTPIVREIAIRYGAVAHPQGDRWHKRPTAMMGGVAIIVSFAATGAVFFRALVHASDAWTVLLASLFMGVVGFVDDVFHIRPYQKLVAQVLAAAAVIYSGLLLPWTASPLVNTAITLFWLVGITNAVNLLDNMDGLAAGVGGIAAAFLAINLALNGQPELAVVLSVVAATLVGFLIYNWNPASIFMGDTGSMFLGFFLASASLLAVNGGRYRSFAVVIAVPVLVLFIPIFDTTLVTVARKLSGRAASQGGRDHTSHRLVALGMSERSAVWLLYGLTILSGTMALLVNRIADAPTSVALVTLFAVALSLLGVYLAGVRVYDEEEIRAARSQPFISFIVGVSYKRRIFEVCLDVVLILLALYASYLLTAPGLLQEWSSFVRQAAIVVTAQLLALLACGAYRGLWRYVSIDNLVIFLKSVLSGTAISYVVVRWVAVIAAPLQTYVLSGIILLMLITFSRVAFRVFGRLLSSRGKTGMHRVVIYGAGDAGELLARELMNNPGHHLTPVCFIDDDPLKEGRVIHGLRVHAGNGNLMAVCRAGDAQQVIVSSDKIASRRLPEIQEVCAHAGITVRRMRLELETLTPISAPRVADPAARTAEGHRPHPHFASSRGEKERHSRR